MGKKKRTPIAWEKLETPKGYPDDSITRAAVGKLLKSYDGAIRKVHNYLEGRRRQVPAKGRLPEKFPEWVPAAEAK